MLFSASEGDSHNIRLYGLNASDVESAAMEVKSKCDEICRDLSASGDAKQEVVERKSFKQICHSSVTWLDPVPLSICCHKVHCFVSLYL